MFLKLSTYFLEPNKPAVISLYNGTFEKSDNVITRDRMADVSLQGQGVRTAVDTSQWSGKDSITLLNFTTGAAGTWVAGVSIKPRLIEMKAQAFNDYLVHDGVLDMLQWRKDNNATEKDAIEQYAKHVKTIFQVGDKTSEDYKTVFGYLIEFIPLENPYDLHPGHDLKVQLLWQGKPLANQLVYIGTSQHEHTHDTHDHAHTHDEAHQNTHTQENNDGHTHDNNSEIRTDSSGVVLVNLDKSGVYYLRTIYLQNSENEGLTHESNWATLTFEVGEGHHHSHDNDTFNALRKSFIEGSWVTLIFIIVSVAIIVALFFWFNRKKS